MPYAGGPRVTQTKRTCSKGNLSALPLLFLLPPFPNPRVATRRPVFNKFRRVAFDYGAYCFRSDGSAPSGRGVDSYHVRFGTWSMVDNAFGASFCNPLALLRSHCKVQYLEASEVRGRPPPGRSTPPRVKQMRVFSIAVVQQGTPAKTLVAEQELSAFGFFQRGSVQEFLTFFTTTIAERTAPGDRQCIEEQQNVGYAHARLEGLTGVLITDGDYPMRTAFTVLNKVLDEFVAKVPRERWDNLTPGQTVAVFPELKDYLTKFQDPHAADPYLKVQKELDETKVILVG